MLFRHMRRYKKNEDGSTAVEFALLALPFVLTVVAIIELAMYFATATILEGAVGDLSRAVRTGQIFDEGNIDDMDELFTEILCEKSYIVTDCDSFQYEVIQINSFGDAGDVDLVLDEDGNFADPQNDLNNLDAGCIGVIRILYPYQFITPFFGDVFATYPNRVRVIIATTVVKTEPFNFDSAGGCIS